MFGFFKLSVTVGQHYGNGKVEIYVYDAADPTTGDTVSFDITWLEAVNITENALTASTIYPNPATDVLNIRIENGQAEQSIEVYSSTMQKVREFSLNQSQNYISVSVSDMDKGMYFVKYANQISKLVVN